MINSKSILHLSYTDTHYIGDYRGYEKSSESLVCIIKDGPGIWWKPEHIWLCDEVICDDYKRQEHRPSEEIPQICYARARGYHRNEILEIKTILSLVVYHYFFIFTNSRSSFMIYYRRRWVFLALFLACIFMLFPYSNAKIFYGFSYLKHPWVWSIRRYRSWLISYQSITLCYSRRKTRTRMKLECTPT
jgi:hypothetical protein